MKKPQQISLVSLWYIPFWFNQIRITLSLAVGDAGDESVCDVNKLFFDVFVESSEVSEDDDMEEAVLGHLFRLPVLGWAS